MLSDEELALQFRRTPIPPWTVPHHLLPYATHLAKTRKGQRRGELLLATQHIYNNLNAQQPTRVFFPPQDRAFNGQALLRRRRV